MTRIDRAMTIWMISMLVMVFVILPATIIITASISNAPAEVAKPTATFESEPEQHEPESRLISWRSSDTFHRNFKSGKYYYNAPKHTYRASQLVVMPYGVNYITPYVRANICEHGEYRHIASETCCPQ